MIGGSCAVNLYLNFKASVVLDFTSVLLNDLVPNKVSLKYFKRFILDYYVDDVIASRTYEMILEADEKSETIEAELSKLGVSDERLKLIYIIFFRKSLLEGTISNNEELMKIYRLIITSIFVSLELDKYIIPDASFTKHEYDVVIKKIISKNKEIITDEIKKSLERCSSLLKKRFDKAISINNKFLKKYNNNSTFNVELIGFKPCVRVNNSELFYSRLKFILDKLDNEKPKEVEKILNKSDIVTRFANLELEIAAFNALSSALRGEKGRIYVDLPDGYLGKMTNINSLTNLVSSVKSRLFLNIRYDQLLKYNNTVRDLNSEGYSFTVTKGDADIDAKKLYGTKGCFIPYDTTVTFLKNVDNAKLGRVEVIVIGASGKKETAICYDKKVDYIVNI